MPRHLVVFLAIGACGPAPQPIDLPSDLAAQGAPVGVRTEVVGEQTFEIWYPADQREEGVAGNPVSLTEFFPDDFYERVPGVTLPDLRSPAVRDAAPRPPEAPYPVVLFSHGFGAFRTQSVSLTAHLASRGYVVVAPDHPGRMVTDIAPCLFDPPLDNCDLANLVPVGADDPAQEDLEDALAWLSDATGEDGWLEGVADLDTLGIFGHSAGGFSTSKFADEHPEVGAALTMAGAETIDRDVPAAFLAGSCDGVVEAASIIEASDSLVDGALVEMAGVGHMAFSDICGFGLDTLAAEFLEPREDVNDFLLTQMITLATDGCEGYAPPEDLTCGDAYLPIADSDRLIRHLVTGWFDAQLLGGATAWTPEDPAVTVTVRP
jgi:predicted dienelactone hydrolase